VVLDLGLSDAVGLEALARLRDDAPTVAVVVLTGLDDEGRGAEAVAAGAQDYLVKGSVDGLLLARSLRYAVERRRAETSAQQLREAELQRGENLRLERGLLPRLLLGGDVGWATHYAPGGGRSLLGGDFYDAIELPDGSVRLCIGDVCGHGADEAALGVCLRIAWRALTLAGLDPEQTLTALDAILVRERWSDEVFATACAVEVTADRRELRLQRAGHPPPLLLGAHGVAAAQAPSLPPLGMVPGFSWPATPVELEAGGALLLYTDGVVEGRDGEGRLGVEGLARLVAGAGDVAPAALLRALLAQVTARHGGPLSDDVAQLYASFA
jgi:serine phosphatase RsbU (regulator of sigma subunit)